MIIILSQAFSVFVFCFKVEAMCFHFGYCVVTPEHIEEMYDVVLVFRGTTTDLKHSQELHVLQQCVYRQAVRV